MKYVFAPLSKYILWLFDRFLFESIIKSLSGIFKIPFVCLSWVVVLLFKVVIADTFNVVTSGVARLSVVFPDTFNADINVAGLLRVD